MEKASTKEIKKSTKTATRGKKKIVNDVAQETPLIIEAEATITKPALRRKTKVTKKTEENGVVTPAIVEEEAITAPTKGRGKKTTVAKKVAEEAKAEVPTVAAKTVLNGRVKRVAKEMAESVDSEEVTKPTTKSKRVKRTPEVNGNEETTSKDKTPTTKEQPTTTKSKRNGRQAKVAEVAEVVDKKATTKRGGKKIAEEKQGTSTEIQKKKKNKKEEEAGDAINNVEEKTKKRATKNRKKEDVENLGVLEKKSQTPEKESVEKKSRKRGATTTKDKKNDASDSVTAAKVLKNSTTTTYDKASFELLKEHTFKISSWNVAGLRSWIKKDGFKFLEYEEPDIFCLQEVKCEEEQLPEEATHLPGYHRYWLCKPGGNAGVALYSRIMPINVEYGLNNEEFDVHGRMITAEYEKFFLINVYVPNSGRKLVNLESRMRWEQLFREEVQRLDNLKPVIICGDMNVSHEPIDLANPKANTRNAGFTAEEREKMSNLLAGGFVDTYRHFYPKQEGAYTFWTYMGNARSRNVGWRLDYFLVSKRFLPRVVDQTLRKQVMGSDHCPITLFLDI